MKTQFATVSRVTSLIAGVIAISVTLLAPTGYFYVARYYIVRAMAAQNELVASKITGIVVNNPKNWRFEEIRVSEIIHRHDPSEGLMSRRVVDTKGMVVAETSAQLPWPVISSTHAIYDAGVVVALVELRRSLRPLVIRTTVVALLSMAMGGLIFIVLRLIPMRAVRQAYGELSQSELRYRSLYSSMREGLGLFEPVYDPEGTITDIRILDVNPTLEKIVDTPRQALIGASGANLLGGTFLDHRVRIRSVLTGDTFCFETAEASSGRHFDISLFAPSPLTFAALVEDVTERKQTEAQIHKLAYYDHLTELPNRFLLRERLEQHLVRAARDASRLALLFLDLDRFKHVNDTLGHAQGDALLIEVGRRISEDRRKCDTIARLGGDEFVVLVSFAGEGNGLAHLAKKLIDKLATPFTIAGRQVFSGASIGISIFPTDGDDADTLLKNADLAMYAAKEAGRSNYCFFTPEMNSRAYARMEMDAKLRYALSHDEFFLEFQPVIDLATNQVASAEALLRWRDSEGKLVMPGEFIPVAEESGLILGLGDWVIRKACRKLKAWEDAGLPLVKVSVNVSARQFGQRSFSDFLFAEIDASGVAPRYLELELTESSLMDDPRQVAEILTKIKARGLSIAIDDFGTGYSSLSYLTRFPIDRLKIDRSFVRNVTTKASDRAVVEAIVAMAEKLGLRVVVEGVETEEQVSFLQGLGCQFIQGFYFHRPMPEAQFLERLTS